MIPNDPEKVGRKVGRGAAGRRSGPLGWYVREVRRAGRPVRWEAGVRSAGKYRTRSFTSEGLARGWAREEAAREVLQPGQGQVVAVAWTADLAREYLAELRTLGRAAATVADVRRMLAAFAAAVPRLDGPGAAAQAGQWIGGLQGTGKGRGGRVAALAPARRNKYLVNARALCRWAVRSRGLREDPTRHLRMASVDERLRPQCSVAELRELVTARRDSATWRWVALMVYAGLRSDEARWMRWRDLDWGAGVLTVSLESGARVKRRRERLVPIQSELAALLRPLAGAPGDRVVDLGPGNLGRAWRDLLAARGIELRGRTPHSCRHSYAGLMTATGVPTALVGAYLGHSAAQTTLRYTQLAARYAQDPEVATWSRGELRLLTGVVSRWPRRRG
jgi:integrase